MTATSLPPPPPSLTHIPTYLTGELLVIAVKIAIARSIVGKHESKIQIEMIQQTEPALNKLKVE